MDKFYRRLRDLREDHDMSQAEVAEFLGIHRQQYYRYEIGYREIPVHMVVRLAHLYKTSADYILGMTNNPKPYNDIPE